MWRYFPGSIKECLKSKYSQTIQSKNPNNQICCYTRKLSHVRHSDQDEGHFHGQSDTNAKGHQKKTWETDYSQILQRNLIGALGWSGVLVLGWYLSQASRFRTLVGKKNHQQDGDRVKYVSPMGVLVRSVLAQPLNQILPKTFTSAIERQTGGEFVSEALDQAAENLSRAHGSVENRLGVELARRQRHKEAATLFRRAADRGHATAAFNLGLCHELGLGTTQDFTKAAELYEMASLGGHATATYNLGVFYVHGWGGKEPDRVRARQLFVTAAHLGQVDARKALGMTEKKTQQPADCPPISYNGKNDTRSISQLVKDTLRKYTSLLEA